MKEKEPRKNSPEKKFYSPNEIKKIFPKDYHSICYLFNVKNSFKPAHKGAGKGTSNFYSYDDVLTMAVISYMGKAKIKISEEKLISKSVKNRETFALIFGPISILIDMVQIISIVNDLIKERLNG